MGLPLEYRESTSSFPNRDGALRVTLVLASALVNADIQPYRFQCWQLLPFIHLHATFILRILRDFSPLLLSVVSDI